MMAAIAVVALLSWLVVWLLIGRLWDRLDEADARRFERYIRLQWSEKHPEEPY